MKPELSFGKVTWPIGPAKGSVVVRLECGWKGFAMLNLNQDWETGRGERGVSLRLFLELTPTGRAGTGG